MKIIFSRKVFDTCNGGFPNPIFENNRMFSIPTPDKNFIFYKGQDIKILRVIFGPTGKCSIRIKK